MTQRNATPPYSNILNELIVHVVGTRKYIHPLQSSQCKIEQVTPESCRVQVFYRGNLLVLLVKGNQLTVEQVVTDPRRRKSLDLYLGREKILQDARTGMTFPSIEKSISFALPPTPMEEAKLYFKIPSTFPVKKTWRRDGYYPLSNDYVNIIILNYNGIEWTVPCVKSIYEKTDYPFELIIVDNCSDAENIRGLRKLLREVMPYPMTVVLQSGRCGFGAACNYGMKISRGKHVLLLNNDTVVQTDGWLKKLIKCAEEDPKIGIVGCRLLFPNGRLQHGGGKLKSNGGCYHPHHGALVGEKDFISSYDCDFVTFAVALIKREVLYLLGGLDSETFYSGYEDVDYCVRAWNAGLRVRYCGDVTLTHYESVTDKKLGLKKTQMSVFQKKWSFIGGKWR